MAAAPEKARRRWFPSAPDRCVLGLLALEGFLLLSAWFRWFPFNQHKGWSVLICLATVGAAFVLMFLWFLAALIFRLRFQFSILSLLLLVVVVAVPFAWLETEMNAARKQREAVERIVSDGGLVYYDYRFNINLPRMWISDPTQKRRGWLRKVLKRDLFSDVTWVRLNGLKVTDAEVEQLKELPELQFLTLDNTKISDAGLVHLKGLTQLHGLGISGSQVSDTGLEHLKALTQLEKLFLIETKVTDAGVEKLQQALPNCTIYR